MCWRKRYDCRLTIGDCRLIVEDREVERTNNIGDCRFKIDDWKKEK